MLKFTKFMMTCSIAATLTMASNSAHAGPECSVDFREAMTRYAQMQRIHDYAVTTGVQKQSDSVMALTCFDDLVGVTSRAGEIFSDVAPDAAMATWGAVAYDIAGITNGIGLYHSTIGLTNALPFDLAYVVSTPLRAFLSSNFDVNEVRVDDIDTDVYTSGLPLGSWAQKVDDAVGGMGIGAYLTIVTNLINLANNAGTDYNCDNMQRFWSEHATRQGTDTSMPYLPYDLLVAGTTSGNDQYNDVIGQTDNATLISNAQSDYNEMVNATETFDFERTMPDPCGSGGPNELCPDSTVADVIAQM